jgi:hypothetical protein
VALRAAAVRDAALATPDPFGLVVLVPPPRETDQFSEEEHPGSRDRVADHTRAIGVVAISGSSEAAAPRCAPPRAEKPAARLEAQVATLTRELESRTGRRPRPIEQSRGNGRTCSSRNAARVAQTEKRPVAAHGRVPAPARKSSRALQSINGIAAQQRPVCRHQLRALPDHCSSQSSSATSAAPLPGAVAAKDPADGTGRRRVLFSTKSARCATVQAKLLRVLEEREFQRLGARACSCRHPVIARRRNRDLHPRCGAASFREDLYYRLGVFEMALRRCASGSTTFPISPIRSSKEIGETVGVRRPHSRGSQRPTARLLMARQRARASQRESNAR